jgi:hypothetical protein
MYIAEVPKLLYIALPLTLCSRDRQKYFCWQDVGVV